MGLRPISANLRDALLQNSHTIVILTFFALAPRENRGGPPGAGFGVGKGTNGMGRTSSPGGPSTPRTERCVMR
jgi:hypothetical protein